MRVNKMLQSFLHISRRKFAIFDTTTSGTLWTFLLVRLESTHQNSLLAVRTRDRKLLHKTTGAVVLLNNEGLRAAERAFGYLFQVFGAYKIVTFNAKHGIFHNIAADRTLKRRCWKTCWFQFYYVIIMQY